MTGDRDGGESEGDALDVGDRTAAVTRETAETAVEVALDVDGDGEGTADTGIDYLDHMLRALATHGLFDLTVRAEGDLAVDDHHTVEDVGVALGTALDDALGDRRGVERFADRRVPLDEAVADVVLDLSGRPRWYFEGEFAAERVGDLTADMARHFFESLAHNADLTLHATVGQSPNAHHQVEALFKAVARALDDATRVDERRGVPSTKGEL
jgi:imidazoleglycerol-phosphate dehydratase